MARVYLKEWLTYEAKYGLIWMAFIYSFPINKVLKKKKTIPLALQDNSSQDLNINYVFCIKSAAGQVSDIIL